MRLFGTGYRAANPIRGFANLKFYVDSKITPPHVSSASNIDLWTDLSGQANHLNLIPTGVNAPQLQGDGSLKVVAASSQGICHSTAGVTTTGAFSIGVLVKVNAAVDGGILFGDLDLTTGGVAAKMATTSYNLDYYAVSGHSDGVADLTAYHSLLFYRSNSAALGFKLDGVVTTIGSDATNPVLGAATFGGIAMGCFGNWNTGFSSCQILAAFICGGTNIGATAAGRVHTYWKYRYGLPA